MAKKSKLFKNLKEVKKSAMGTIISSSITGGTYLASKAAGNYVTSKLENPKYKNIPGPGMVIIGMALEAFSDNQYLTAVGRGIAIAGFDKSANDFLPEETKTKMFLNGVPSVGQTTKNETQQKYDNEYFANLAREAEQEALRNAALYEQRNNANASASATVDGVDVDEIEEAFIINAI